MIEAYRIGVSLVLDPTRLVGPLNEALRVFERVQKASSDTQASITGMASGLRNAATAARTLADAMDRVAAASQRTANARSAGGAGASGPGVGLVPAPLLLAGPGGPASPGARMPMLLPPPRGGGGAGGHEPGGHGPGGPIPLNFPTGPGAFPLYDSMMAGYGLTMLGHGTADMLGSVFGAGFDANSLLAKMRASRFTEEQIEQAKAQARELVTKVPGFSYGQGLDLVLQTSSFTGDVGEALKLAPNLAFNAQVLSQFGKKDAIAQVESAIKAGELTGLTNKKGEIDLPKMMDFVDRLTAVVVSGAGTLDINKYLTGLRQFGSGSVAANKDFLTAVLPAYMKIMSESKAGTAFSSLEQSLFAPTSPTNGKRYRAEQERIGIRDKSGNVVEPDKLRSDPFAWTTEVLLPKLYGKGFDTAGKIQSELLNVFPRQTIARLMDAGIFDAAVIDKEANRNREQIAAGAAPLDKMLKESPQNQVAAFHAAVNMMLITLADPNMGVATKSLGDITGVIRAFTNEVEKHPTLGRILIDAAAGLALVGVAAGGLLLALGPMVALSKVMGWTKATAGGGAVAAAGRSLLGPLAAGATVHMLDSDDAIGKWMDEHIPGAAGIDRWFYEHTGGAVGRPSDAAPSAAPGQAVQLHGDVNLDGKKVGSIVANTLADQYSRSAAGTSGSDMRVSPMLPGMDGGWAP